MALILLAPNVRNTPFREDYRRRMVARHVRAAAAALRTAPGATAKRLRLRPVDLDPNAPILRLVNLKQRKRPKGGGLPRKVVIVSPELVAQLRALSRDLGVRHTGYFFRSQKSHGEPMSYGHCWRLIRQYSIAAGVFVSGNDADLRPANGRDFGTARRSTKGVVNLFGSN